MQLEFSNVAGDCITTRAPGLYSVTVSANPTSAVLGERVALTAVVHGPRPPGRGTITFSDGSTRLGARLLGIGNAATLYTRKLAVGSHSITATFCTTR
jgi:hypothetical protein